MISLASAEPLPDYEKILKCIRRGGKKAAKWLEDKEKSNNMTLAGIYQPLRKILVEIWKVAPTTSNGNEQVHRNINWDGMQLTMLAGIMCGFQYDSRAIQSCHIFTQEGVHVHDQNSTPFRRARKAIGKKERGQRKIVELKDSQITQVNETIIKLQQNVQTNAQGVKHALELESPEKIETAIKQLRTTNNTLQKKHDKLDKLISQGSGCIIPSGILPAQELFNHKLLDRPAELERTEMNSTSNAPSPSAISPPNSLCAWLAISLLVFTSNLCMPSSQGSRPRPSYASPSSQPSVHETSQRPPLNPYPTFPQYFPNYPPNVSTAPITYPSHPHCHGAQPRPSNPYLLPPQPSYFPQPHPSNPYPVPPNTQDCLSNDYPLSPITYPSHPHCHDAQPHPSNPYLLPPTIQYAPQLSCQPGSTSCGDS